MSRAGSLMKAACAAFCAVLIVPAVALAQPGGPPPDYGIDFVTIGSPGNAAFFDPDNAWLTNHRGSVPYAYRIARTEVTTAQWMQYVNTFSTQSNQMALFGAPVFWGAVPDPNYHGPGRRWVLNSSNPTAAINPVFGITWRDAAMYCNWLNNNQSSDLSALSHGAYDTSTFTINPDGTFNDQRTHDPAARFWIPTLDEWLKAAHFDPNRYGAGQPGWWLYDDSSDTPPIPGPPGVGQTSAGYVIPPFGHYYIPLGAYPSTLSPWGLLDTSGGATEYTEETFEEHFQPPGRRWRFSDGAAAGSYPVGMLDHIGFVLSVYPTENELASLRIVSVVPGPGSFGVLAVALALALTRRRSPC